MKFLSPPSVRSVGFTLACRGLALPVLMLGLVSFVSGQNAAEPDPILVAARAAAAEKNVTKSKLLGFGISNRPFDEIPPTGGLLVGFDVGLHKDNDTIAALRPIYRTTAGETYFKEYGVFFSSGSGKKMIKSHVGSTVRVSASSGYAVGSITMRAGLGIDGMSLKYMRIDGTRLDKNQSYTSKWIGSERGGNEGTVGDGTPIIGVFGHANDLTVCGLGVYSMKTAPTPMPMPVVPPPPPPPPTAKKPPVETKPEVVRPSQPAPTVKEAQTELPINARVATEDDETGQMPPWMLLGMVVMVLIPGVVGLAVVFARKAAGAAQPTVEHEPPGGKPAFDLDELRGLAGLAPLPDNAIRSQPAKPLPGTRPEPGMQGPARREDERPSS